MTPPFASHGAAEPVLLPDDAPRPGVLYTFSAETIVGMASTPEELDKAFDLDAPGEAFDLDALDDHLEACAASQK
jgi:hypothetical protein